MGRAIALALHRDHPKTSARGMISDIAVVEERGEPRSDEPVGDCRTDQPAANHDRIEARQMTAKLNGLRSWMQRASIRSAAVGLRLM